MTNLERDIQRFILKTLSAADGPVAEFTLVDAIKNGFPHIAFTAAEIYQHIRAAETAGWTSGNRDSLFGLMWGLTPKGQNKAQQLI